MYYSLRCPRNVSVKCQLKVPHRSFVISFLKCLFWVEVERRCFHTCLFKCKWADGPRPPFPEYGCLYSSFLRYSDKNICLVLVIISIALKSCVFMQLLIDGFLNAHRKQLSHGMCVLNVCVLFHVLLRLNCQIHTSLCFKNTNYKNSRLCLWRQTAGKEIACLYSI